jgi:uncharacterized protein with HEPN domain
MSPEDKDLAYLWDMLDAAKTVARIFEATTERAWDENETLRLAVERGVEIVGEAARRVSKTYQKQHPEIPWRRIIGQRNVLAHEYGDIDYKQLFDTAKRDIPVLIAQLEKLLPPT